MYFYVYFKNLTIHTDHFPSGINLQFFLMDTESVLFEVLTRDLRGCVLYTNIKFLRTCLCLKRLVAGPTTRRLMFDPGAALVGSVVD